MRTGRLFAALIVVLCLNLGTGYRLAHGARPVQNGPSAAAVYGRLPLTFEENVGQMNRQVSFLARTGAYTLYLTRQDAVMAFTPHVPAAGRAGSPGWVQRVFARQLSRTGIRPASRPTFRMHLMGANSHLTVSGLHQFPGVVNYFIGSDPQKWHTNIPTFAGVQYTDAYQGIDLVYHSHGAELEYDWVVHPGANPDAIKVRYSGAAHLRLDRRGNLLIQSGAVTVRQLAPHIYQQIGSLRRAVAGRYLLSRSGLVGFSVGRHDTRVPLVIDPVVEYSTYLGGTGDDQAYGIAVDSSGSAYITGNTTSGNFPVHGAFQSLPGGGSADAFVTKLNPAGNGFVYSTYLGGRGFDVGFGIAVDKGGDAFVTGGTNSPNFPLQNARQTAVAGGADIFVTELNPSGNGLVFSTYWGGSGDDVGNRIAVDSSGDPVVFGITSSTNFPTLNAAQNTNGGGPFDAVLFKMNPGGAGLVYSTYLGGNGDDETWGLDLDAAGDAYVAGSTSSTNFPTVNAVQATYGGGSTDGFVAKEGANGGPLLFSTYLGGNGSDFAYGISLDQSGSIYVVGDSNSTNFPATAVAKARRATTRADMQQAGGNEAYAAKMPPSGQQVTATRVPNQHSNETCKTTSGPATSPANDFKPDPLITFGKATPSSTTHSQLGVQVLSLDTLKPLRTISLGASGDIELGDMAVDPDGNAYITAFTNGTDFPTTSAVQPTYAGGPNDAIVFKVGDLVPPATEATH